MSNTKTTEQIFLSHIENCPFCDTELSKRIKDESFIDDRETTLYEYGCGFQARVDVSVTPTQEEVTRLTTQNVCSNKTVALETVLKLQHQINPK